MSERVLVAMSGGVDSSVAAALLLEAGHEVVGVTLKLWGGESDRGCCSVADVDDARSVARRLGIDHHVFNFGDDFEAHVVAPYVEAHAAGRTPNPCIECNRHLKFDRLLRRADALGFDAVATGHHARVVDDRVARGADAAKDQSYVLHMLGPDQLRRIRFPVGEMTKDQVRDHAARLGLATADKPDSQDVCFITATGGRETFLGSRIPMRPGTVVDRSGAPVGTVPRRGAGDPRPAEGPRPAGRGTRAVRRGHRRGRCGRHRRRRVRSAHRPDRARRARVGRRSGRWRAARPVLRPRRARAAVASRRTPCCSPNPPGVWHRARASCCTPVTWSSPRAPPSDERTNPQRCGGGSPSQALRGGPIEVGGMAGPPRAPAALDPAATRRR